MTFSMASVNDFIISMIVEVSVTVCCVVVCCGLISIGVSDAGAVVLRVLACARVFFFGRPRLVGAMLMPEDCIGPMK